MAKVQSLGLHEPCALPYLIDEGILPNHPSESLYTWQTYPAYDAAGKEIAGDEILQTRNCVVWARGGIVKRAFNLDVEEEEILQSFITHFPAWDRLHPQQNGAAAPDGAEQDQSFRTGEKKARSPRSSERAAGQALVILLKTKAHIYFLTGDTHIVPIPFEVEAAFPTSQGCLLKRKSLTTAVNPAALSAPQNSFVTSQLSSSLTEPQHITLKTASISRPSLTLSLAARKFAPPTAQNDHLPSILSLTDPQAELGTAVRRTELQEGVKVAAQDQERIFDPAEELLYISRNNELASLDVSNLEPLSLGVTLNAKSGILTVWNVQYRKRKSYGPPTKRRKLSHEDHGLRRRSSNMFRVNGSATPIGRGLGESRESLGPELGRSFAETYGSHRPDDQTSREVDNLATELGPDFADVGVQTRAARRVSSMLARTDLSMGPDRAPINGFTSSNPGRKSLSRVGARGDSFGDFSDRQSFGARAGGPIPGIGFSMSSEPPLTSVPPDRLLEGFSSGAEFDCFDSMVLDDAMSELPAEVVFSKVHSIPCSVQTPVTQSSKSRFNVFVLTSKPSAESDSAAKATLSIGIMDIKKGELSVIRIACMLARSNNVKRKQASSRTSTSMKKFDLSSVNVQRGTNIIDACKLRDRDQCCILVLMQNRDGQIALLLEAVGVSSIKVDLPGPLMVHNPFAISPATTSDQRRQGGRARVLKEPLRNPTGLGHTSILGQVDVLDSQVHRHRLEIQLEPRHPQVIKVLQTIELALLNKGGSGVCIAWIEVMKWLRSKEYNGSLEWTAMVVTLFSMIIPFIVDRRGKGSVSRRQKKGGLFRSSSGAAIDMTSWDKMVDEECGIGITSPPWTTSPGWQWIGQDSDSSGGSALEQNVLMPSSSITAQALFEGRKNRFLLQCVSLSREFMQSPTGEQMLGPDGFLPTASNKDRETRRKAVGSVLIALHLMREEQKLDTRLSHSKSDSIQLAPVLAQLGHWLSWQSWGYSKGCYYHAEIPDVEQQLFDENATNSFDVASQPFDPPSIFEFVETSASNPGKRSFLTLLDVVEASNSTLKEVCTLRAKNLTPRTFALLQYFSKAASQKSRPARVEWMHKCGLDVETLATLPTGISAIFYDAISSCEGSPPVSWSEPLLQLVGRDDLKRRPLQSSPQAVTSKIHGLISHEATRDYHAVGNLVLDTEPSHSWDSSSEADRQGVTRLIFREDRRFQDASRLVNQLRPPVAECKPEADWTEADLLDAQKELVQLVTMRTLTVASGRGMINYSSRVPLLTEKVPIPAFTLACLVKPSNVTLSAERASFTEDRAVWAFFHNGTAAGLTISKDARGIDTSWILYNKPPELTNRHAGFLLALGLNGHLKSLAKWVAFKYLTPKHTMTSVGLLLGLSASYIGSMDTLITRLLSVHVTRMLPPGAAELNLSPLTQTTGIMGIGLLYCSSQHRRMSEVMLSEIENNDVEEGVPPEQTLRDEGYRLAAGFALGFINLGQGKRLHGLHDMNVMERLLTIAIGTKNVNLVHILDRATSGATIAFALIYMKTNDETIAGKIDIPDTLHQFDYVRPDIFLLRTVARHLIMWSSIQPTYNFIQSSVPKPYRHRASLSSTRHLNSEDMPFFNILAGLCLALGLRFAGSGSHTARDLLTSYLDHFIRLTRLPALNYDSKLTRNAVRNCQDVTALALAAVMAGTGDILVFRRLRSLHGRCDSDTPYGSHLAAHMAIGVLFLGGGTYTLGTSDIAVASLLCAFYPLFPTNVTDNQAHLQAFRHLWVLATEPRCVVCRDVETGRPVSVPITVTLKSGEGGGEEDERRLTAPCLVPELDTIKEIRTEAKGYWDVRIFLEGKDGQEKRNEFKKGHLNVYLRRRAAYDAPRGSVFVSEMQALAERGEAPSVSLSTASASTVGTGGGGGEPGKVNPFDWLWQLDALKELDVSERALVLPRAHTHAGLGRGSGSGNRYLRGTVVDTRLELEHAVLPDAKGRGAVDRDQLWQLRLLFAWVDGLEREEVERRESEGRAGEEVGGEAGAGAGGGRWLRREVIERLRWRVWKMRAAVGDGDDGQHEEGAAA